MSNVTSLRSLLLGLIGLFLLQLELGYNPIGPDGAKALSEVLKFHGNINTLKLGWCQVIIVLDVYFDESSNNVLT